MMQILKRIKKYRKKTNVKESNEKRKKKQQYLNQQSHD